MAATGDLATITRFALERGASVRLVGDDRQLASIAAGGVLRDIQATAGAVTLSELIRFRDQAEAAATLAVRAGDTAGIGFYIDAGRVHVGDQATVTDHAYTAWAADRDAGLDSIMLAPTRELATGLNIRARTDRLTRLRRPARPAGAPWRMGRRPAPGTRSSPAATTGGCAPAPPTGSRTGTGGASPRPAATGHWTWPTCTPVGGSPSPASTCAEHVQLGYATTIHGGQGVTADTSHTITTGTESRQQLYVALTRGRDANHLYLVTAGDGDEHTVITPAATHPLTAINILEQILARDEAQVSATTTSRQLADPAADAAAAPPATATACTPPPSTIQGPGWAEHLDTALEQLAPRHQRTAPPTPRCAGTWPCSPPTGTTPSPRPPPP